MILVLIATVSISACGEKVEAPEKVKTAFLQKYPNATKIKWEKENEKEWEAEFKLDGKEYTVSFDSDGKWLETETEIKKSEIPEAVKSLIDSLYAGYKIDEAEFVETSQGKFYEFELEKGESEIEVSISPEGKLIAKEETEEDED